MMQISNPLFQDLVQVTTRFAVQLILDPEMTVQWRISSEDSQSPSSVQGKFTAISGGFLSPVNVRDETATEKRKHLMSRTVIIRASYGYNNLQTGKFY